MLTNRDGNGIEEELRVRARAEAACAAEFERIKVAADDMPQWMRSTFIGRFLAHKRLMRAYREQERKADVIMSLDRTVGAPHQKLATRILGEAARRVIDSGVSK